MLAYCYSLPPEVQKDFKTISTEAKDWFWHSWRRKYQLTYRRVSGLTQLLPKDATRRVSDVHKLLGSMNAKSNLQDFFGGEMKRPLTQGELPSVTLGHKGSKRVEVKTSGRQPTAVTGWLAGLLISEN